jgi:hypothetical protein
MKTLNFTLTKDENDTITVYKNNQEAGYLDVSNVSDKLVGEIEHVEIYENFRGQGLYKMILIAMLNLSNYQVLLSNNRNNTANAIYEHWVGQELSGTDQVEIRLENESLRFDIEEE